MRKHRQFFLISAGPTREFLDPARYLSNPSSGRMGIELARAASRLGHDVHLVHGSCSIRLPRSPRVRACAVTTALQMRKELCKVFARSDFLIMAAAVCDFRAKRFSARKIKKTAPGAHVLKLVRNPDILCELGQRKKHQIIVGFSAESHDMIRNAKAKLCAKNLDFIVANQIGGTASAFGSKTNRVFVFGKDGSSNSYARISKKRLAGLLIKFFLKSGSA